MEKPDDHAIFEDGQSGGCVKQAQITGLRLCLKPLARLREGAFY
jgi:hypothetical protein